MDFFKTLRRLIREEMGQIRMAPKKKYAALDGNKLWLPDTPVDEWVDVQSDTWLKDTLLDLGVVGVIDFDTGNIRSVGETVAKYRKSQRV